VNQTSGSIGILASSTISSSAPPSVSIFPHFFVPGSGPADFIIQDFAVVMVVAAIMIAITYKLKQPMVIGYILAGILIGPYTPPFSLVKDVSTINVLAELGIIMLLFVVGTEFPMAKLRAVGRVSLVVAMAETLGTLVIVFFTAQHLGFSFYDSLFLGLALSITSTVVTVRVLEDLGMIKDKSSILFLGITVVEDILAISILAILQSVATAGGSTLEPLNLAISIGVVAAFIGGVLFLGSRFFPKIIDKAGKTNDYALLLIVILGLAFGLSYIAHGIGLSVATGAFLAGVLVAESNSAAVARILTLPLRDMFAAIFFVSIGALVNVTLVPQYILPAAILILTSSASKLLIVTGILTRSKYDNITALRTGFGMSAAKGELSLVVVKGGQDVGAITSSILPILGIVTIVTTFIAPYIIRFGSRITTMQQSSSSSSGSNNSSSSTADNDKEGKGGSSNGDKSEEEKAGE
jgi:CPA2 family monovalent cation:H+ antiporter-2